MVRLVPSVSGLVCGKKNGFISHENVFYAWFKGGRSVDVLKIDERR